MEKHAGRRRPLSAAIGTPDCYLTGAIQAERGGSWDTIEFGGWCEGGGGGGQHRSGCQEVEHQSFQLQTIRNKMQL